MAVRFRLARSPTALVCALLVVAVTIYATLPFGNCFANYLVKAQMLASGELLPQDLLRGDRLSRASGTGGPACWHGRHHLRAISNLYRHGDRSVVGDFPARRGQASIAAGWVEYRTFL
jgi:hypothetical protein